MLAAVYAADTLLRRHCYADDTLLFRDAAYARCEKVLARARAAVRCRRCAMYTSIDDAAADANDV